MEYLKQRWRMCEEKSLLVVIAVCLIASLLFPCFNVTGQSAFANGTSVSDQDGAADYSFYQLSNKAASALSTAIADGDNAADVLKERFGEVTPAAAGGLLGYTDMDNNRGVWGMFMSKLSLGANTKEYSSMTSGLIGYVGYNANSSGAGMNSNAFVPYIALGAALNDMGLDQSDSGVNAGASAKRMLFGGIAQIVLAFASTVTALFGFVVSVLQFFNPFQFFNKVSGSSAVTGSVFPGLGATSFTDYMSNIKGKAFTGLGTGLINIDPESVFGQLITMISGYWDILHAVGIGITTILLAVILVKFFMPGRMGRLEGLRGWFIRAFFIIAGIALLGSTYTTCLDWIAGSTSSGNTAAVNVIASTFFDFESWVLQGMPLTNNVTGLGTSFAVVPSSGTVTCNDGNVQGQCFTLNQLARGSATTDLTPFLSSQNRRGVYGAIVGEIQNMYRLGDQGNVAGSDDSGVALSGSNSVLDFKWANDLLNRYMAGTRIYASSYESAWISKHWSTERQGKVLADFINQSDDEDSILADGDVSDIRWTDNFIGEVDGSSITLMNPFAPGTGSISSNLGDVHQSGAQGRNPGFRVPSANAGANTVSYNLDGTHVGSLSAMSIYNYLNTTFNQSSVVVYSSVSSTSEFVRDSHYSVNLIGKGWNSTIIFMTCMLTLMSYAIIGFFYAMSLIMGNVKRGVRLILAVPGAMLGVLQSIAKVVSYTCLMIVEILATMLLYCIFAEFLFALTTTVINMFTDILERLFLADIMDMMSPIIGIVTCIFLIWMCVMAVRIRKPIIKTFEEMADNIVQKFVLGSSHGALAGAPGGAGKAGGGMGSAAAGAAAGVAAAGAARKRGVLGKIQAHNAKSQAETEMRLSQMFGGGSSAVAEENQLDGYAQAKKDNRAMARREKLEAGKKMVVGAGEAAVGYATGNAALMARGAMNVAAGANDFDQADTNQIARDASAAAGSGMTMSTGDIQRKAAGSTADIQKMNLVGEAEGAVKTYVAGAMMGGDATASVSQGNLAAGAAGTSNGAEVVPEIAGGSAQAPQIRQSGATVSNALSSGQADAGMRPVTTGLDGNATAIPAVGDSVRSVEGGRDLVTRTGRNTVVVDTSGGSVEMTANDDGSYTPVKPPEGLNRQQTEESRMIASRVNTIVAAEHNAQVQKTGEGQMMAVQTDGSLTMVPSEQTVNGKNIINIKQDTAIKTENGGTAVVPLPDGSAVKNMSRVMTANETIQVDTLRAIQQGNKGNVTGFVDTGSDTAAASSMPRSISPAQGPAAAVSQPVSGSGFAPAPAPVSQPVSQSAPQSASVRAGGSSDSVQSVTQTRGKSIVAPDNSNILTDADVAPAGGDSSRTVTRRTSVTVAWTRDMNVVSAGGGQPVIPNSGGVSGFSVPNSQLNVSSNDQVNVSHGTQVNHRQGGVINTGSGVSGFKPSGTTRSESVQDNLNVSHDLHVNNQSGGRYESGIGGNRGSGARGSHSSETVRDTHTVNRQTETRSTFQENVAPGLRDEVPRSSGGGRKGGGKHRK